MKLKKPRKKFGTSTIKADRRPKPAGGWPPCFKADCPLDGRNTHTCITCEKLADGDDRKIFVVHYCPLHREMGLKVIKRHALVKHPMNLLRVIGAGLAGEDIT